MKMTEENMHPWQKNELKKLEEFIKSGAMDNKEEKEKDLLSIDIFEDGKKEKISNLPTSIQSAILKYEDDNGAVSFIKYPKDKPIIAGNFLLDGGMGVDSGVILKENLKHVLCLDFIALTADLYEKENKEEKAYLVYRFVEYGEVYEYAVIEI